MSDAPERHGTGRLAAQAERSEYATLDRRRTLHAYDWGALAAVLAAVVYGLCWGVLNLQYGLIAVAIMLGWVIGAAIRRGAWARAAHPATRRLQVLGAVLGVVAWLGGAFVAYLSSRLVLPGSSASLAERLADLPFGEFMTQQYEAGGIAHAVAFAALAIMGWRTAR
ncbi:MAG TPA: hypothetical protein VMP67_00415 [Candidatus Limnocylindria bacterium]|nr:hypothetical protein [Candidatus Limnocylindria bacterium]